MDVLVQNSLRDKLAAVAASIVVENGAVMNSDEAAKSFVEALNGAQFYVEDADWIEKEFEFAGHAFINKCARLLRDLEDEEAPVSAGYFLSCAASNIATKPIDKLMELASTVNSQMPVEEKLMVAKTLEEGLINLAGQGNLRLRDKQLRPEDIANLSAGVSFSFESDGTEISGGYERIIDAIRAIQKEYAILHASGNLDRERLQADRLKFGAKGANLIVVKNLLEKLRNAEIDSRFQYIEIPEFNLIGVELYKKWLRGEDIRDELKKFYTGGALMIRSSAVYSEDGDEITGAGVYQSVALEGDSTFEDFVGGVTEVYESCNSESALDYRKANGVAEELMGLAIQNRIEYPNLGYVNSTRPGTDDLALVGFEGSRKPPLIVYSSKIDRLVFSTDFCDFEELALTAYIQPDIYNYMDGTFEINQALFISRILEKYYGQPVQIEFASVYGHGSPLYFLQCRPLPAKMFNRPKVEFPSDKPHFYECQSEGVCDLELDLLKEHERNDDRDGMVIFNSSHYGSMRTGEILRSFPKNGVVIVLSRSELGHGHIETLAVGKGLTLLFGTDFNEESIMATTKMRATASSGSDKKFRVVSDGRKARVYEV
ncbi:MAG: hypothetical protein AAB836_01280 [Patescibacteria group bacterium]